MQDNSEVDEVGIPIVFVPGIKGLSLYNENDECCYGDPHVFLNLKTPTQHINLPCGFGEDGQQLRDTLQPREPIGYVKILNVKIGDAQGPFLDHIKERCEKNKANFHLFQFDWRRECAENVQHLTTFMRSIIEKHNYKNGVQLIAHSLGAHISLPILSQYPKWFHSIAWVAPGFQTGIGFLEDISLHAKYSQFREHNNTGLNTTLFSPTFWATSPSAWGFFPTKCMSAGRPFLVDTEGNEIEIDFYNLEDYKKHKLAIYHPRSEVEVTEEMESFLTQILKRAEKFRYEIDGLSFEGDQPPQRALLAIGKGVPVQYVLDKNNNDDHVGWRTARMVDGDGRLKITNIMPAPHGLKVTEFVSTTKGHMQCLTDRDKLDRMLDKLLLDANNRIQKQMQQQQPQEEQQQQQHHQQQHEEVEVEEEEEQEAKDEKEEEKTKNQHSKRQINPKNTNDKKKRKT